MSPYMTPVKPKYKSRIVFYLFISLLAIPFFIEAQNNASKNVFRSKSEIDSVLKVMCGYHEKNSVFYMNNYAYSKLLESNPQSIKLLDSLKRVELSSELERLDALNDAISTNEIGLFSQLVAYDKKYSEHDLDSLIDVGIAYRRALIDSGLYSLRSDGKFQLSEFADSYFKSLQDHNYYCYYKSKSAGINATYEDYRSSLGALVKSDVWERQKLALLEIRGNQKRANEEKVKSRLEQIASKKDYVTIGNQVWMVDNLDVERFRNGDIIPQATSNLEWTNAIKNKQPAWCYFRNDGYILNGPDKKIYNGKIYNWYAVNDYRQLAPEGWRIPSIIDWRVLDKFLGERNYLGHLQSQDFNWNTCNADNSTGFSCNQGAYRIDCGNLPDPCFKEAPYFWTSEGDAVQLNGSADFKCNIQFYENQINTLRTGYNIRCVKN